MSLHQQLGTGEALPQDRYRGAFACEPFVDADLAAEFLMVKRKTILDWARSGAIPAHRYGRGKRVVWRFRISELAGADSGSRSTMPLRQS
jgi:excisionase family DNA binding protein